MSGTSASIFIQEFQTEVQVCQQLVVVPQIWYYDGFGGGVIANVPPATQTPTAIESATTGIRAPIANFNNRADNYSARIQGFIKPTISGAYTFYCSSDDASRFSLGSAGGTIASAAPIITNAGYTGGPGVSGNNSAVINLVAGQLYPFEAIYSEGGGGDYIQVDWSGPVGGRQVVPSSVLSASGSSFSVRKVYRTTRTDANGIQTFTYRLVDGTVVTPTLAEPIVDCP